MILKYMSVMDNMSFQHKAVMWQWYTCHVYVWRIAFFDNNGIYLLNTLHLTRLLLYNVPITLCDYFILKQSHWVSENKGEKYKSAVNSH